jgi:hypothetical protein
MMKTIPNSPPRRPPPRRKPRPTAEVAVLPSSPPPRTYEPMSEIDHPLLSEGLCLPRMGYLRGDVYEESGDDDAVAEKENVEPEDEMERFFSDVLA